MAQIPVKQVCHQCGGTGTFGSGGTQDGPPGPFPCDWKGCGGTGYVELGYVELDPSVGDLSSQVTSEHTTLRDLLKDYLDLKFDTLTSQLQVYLDGKFAGMTSEHTTLHNKLVEIENKIDAL